MGTEYMWKLHIMVFLHTVSATVSARSKKGFPSLLA
jgi:hypothetical protein